MIVIDAREPGKPAWDRGRLARNMLDGALLAIRVRDVRDPSSDARDPGGIIGLRCHNARASSGLVRESELNRK